MNKNNLFKALQAGYELTYSEPITNDISVELFVKSLKHDIYENGLVILLNDFINNIESPSVFCAGRMIIEDLTLLKEIEIGFLQNNEIQQANLTQRYRVNRTERLFLNSIAAIKDKESQSIFVDEECAEILAKYDKLSQIIAKREDASLENYEVFTKKGMKLLVDKALGPIYTEYRKIFSFFLHWNLLDEEIERPLVKKATDALQVLLSEVEKLVYSDVSKSNLPKYKSFSSYIDKNKDDYQKFTKIDYSWKKAMWYYNTIEIDKYCFKRFRAISLDFKICQIFGLKESICKRSKTFVEIGSIVERLTNFYDSDESIDFIVNLLKVASVVRLPSVTADADILDKADIDRVSMNFYNEFIKDKKDISYEGMIKILKEGALSFYGLIGTTKTIANNVLSFSDDQTLPEIDRLLLNVLFKTGNKIDHFTGGYPAYSHQVIDYWSSRTYLQTILFLYSYMYRVVASFKKDVFDKEAITAINNAALEMMDNGADEFLKVVKSEYDPADGNPFASQLSTTDGKQFDIISDYFGKEEDKNLLKDIPDYLKINK